MCAQVVVRLVGASSVTLSPGTAGASLINWTKRLTTQPSMRPTTSFMDKVYGKDETTGSQGSQTRAECSESSEPPTSPLPCWGNDTTPTSGTDKIGLLPVTVPEANATETEADDSIKAYHDGASAGTPRYARISSKKLGPKQLMAVMVDRVGTTVCYPIQLGQIGGGVY
jgi:hypothetical protein